MSADGSPASARERVDAFLTYRLPAGVGWPHVTGSLLMTLFAVQLLTGFLMALYYSPSAAQAWESVRYIETEVQFGAWIRAVHHWASSIFVPLAAIHLAIAFISGAYRAPRRWTWVTGCMLLAVVLGFGFTGYLLPWDLKAYFGTRVGIDIAASAPYVGEPIGRLLAGGPEVDELTLPRFFALHAIALPLCFVGLVLVHLWLMRLHGLTTHWKHLEGEESRELFHPHQTLRNALAGFVMVALLVGFAYVFGAPLEERADPQNASYVPRPEWYFLGAQQLLRVFQGEYELVGSVGIPALGALLMLGLPWLDRSRERRPSRRPIAMTGGALVALCTIGLTVWGAIELGNEEAAMAARIAARADDEPSEAEEPEAPPGLDDAELAQLGRRLYEELACEACHADGSVGWRWGAPLLDVQGDRSSAAWTAAYLLAPTRIRLVEEGELPMMRMPDYLLDETEAAALAAHLARSSDPERVPPVDDAGPADAELLAAGELLYDDLDCQSCHVLAGEGEPLGPDLDGVGARRTLAYLRAIVQDPEGVIPGTAMTDYDLEPEESLAVARWLETLR